uniref:Uncharacterized protein n=1 Tax=Arundo donax TaxID=35708 RepID=A0A0A9F487_ARUDO
MFKVAIKYLSLSRRYNSNCIFQTIGSFDWQVTNSFSFGF